MQIRRMIVPGMAVLLIAMSARVARAGGVASAAPGQVSLQVQVGGWDAPPGELNEIQRQGFHDGIEGARRDFDNHRPPDVNNRDEYRHPNLPRGQREAYRDGFRRGYRVAMDHMMRGPGPQYGQPVPPPPVVRGDWNTVPGEFNDAQRRGFVDGIEGARKDYENHRQPNVENRDEYRHPNMPGSLRGAYREGFRRGYDRGWAHLAGRPWRD
ncbi:MAG TPA: hypothetical protein VHE33_12690 [Acidobacteriaceae bacterium]|nr:hypothetical protein [Acidobacteriaceae bacterium]